LTNRKTGPVHTNNINFPLLLRNYESQATLKTQLDSPARSPERNDSSTNPLVENSKKRLTQVLKGNGIYRPKLSLYFYRTVRK